MTYKKMYDVLQKGIMFLIKFAVFSYVIVFLSLIMKTLNKPMIAFTLIFLMGGFIIYWDIRMLQIKRWLSKEIERKIIEKFCSDSNYLCLHDIVVQNPDTIGEDKIPEYEWIDHVIITGKAIFVIETKFNNAYEIDGKATDLKWIYVSRRLVTNKKVKQRGENSFRVNDRHINVLKKIVDMDDVIFVNYVSFIDWVKFNCTGGYEVHRKYVRPADIPVSIDTDLRHIEKERMDTTKMSRICIKLHDAEIKDKYIRKECIKRYENSQNITSNEFEVSKNKVLLGLEDEQEKEEAEKMTALEEENE